MANMPDHRKRNTFTSYVAPSPAQLFVGDISSLQLDNEWFLKNDTIDVHLAKPRLLPSELIVASAPAYLYSAIANIDNTSVGENSTLSKNNTKQEDTSVFGLLSVTNFKLAFVPLQKDNNINPTVGAVSGYCPQQHLLLQRNEVTLNNIDHIVQIAETGRAVSALPGNASRRKKRLDAQQKLMNSRIAALHVVCKNFRLLKFVFQYSSKTARDWGKLIASALARFAFTSRHDLSFAYCYREPYYSTMVKSGISMYVTKNDWARELIRCAATNWQVISSENVPLLRQNHQHILSNHPSASTTSLKYTLPSNFVIPKACSIDRFLDLSRAFCDSRAAFWVYGYGTASLVRLGELKPSVQQDTTVENVMLELVRASNERKMLHLLQLTDRLPNIQDVQRAYQKLRRLCIPESVQQFLIEDSKFLTLFEKTNWLFYVSLCIRYSCEASDTLKAGTTCVLQETNGRDLCCVVSSLTQIILDPLYRTIDGFQSLIQKEWIALEHPFQTRLGHVRQLSDSTVPDEESPVFLLFLDCVWQLLQQYPEEFEFSQTYLTTLWDSCFMPLFDTFQFDCNADRLRAVREFHLILRPVWDWSEQFSEKDKVFFTNPFYQSEYQEMPCRRSVAIPANAIMLPGLAKTMPIQTMTTFTTNRSTLNPQSIKNQLLTTSTKHKDRYLEPQYCMAALSIWEQCYYRWMPILEIKNGGYPQIDLYCRLLQNNISKLQRCLELQDFDELPDIYYELSHETKPLLRSNELNHSLTTEYIDGVERRRKSLPPATININNIAGCNSANENININLFPEISSFFPFSGNVKETQQLHEILTNSNEFLLEGSIVERLSIT